MQFFRSILYVSDASVAQEASMARAVSLAENNQADLAVMAVVPAVSRRVGKLPEGHAASELQEAMVSARRQELEALVAPYAARLDIAVDVRVGTAFLEVIYAVLRHRHELVVKAAENPSFLERLFGSDDMQLLRNCPCPVWLMPADQREQSARILAAVDLDPFEPDAAHDQLNERILAVAGSLALSDFAELHLVHAWDAIGEKIVSLWSDDTSEAGAAYAKGLRTSHGQALKRANQQFRKRLGDETHDHVAPRLHLRRGVASRVIPEVVRELKVDLVVMGTVARAGIAGLLIGNTAEAILEQVQCSVLAVKPPGFVSPVQPP